MNIFAIIASAIAGLWRSKQTQPGECKDRPLKRVMFALVLVIVVWFLIWPTEARRAIEDAADSMPLWLKTTIAAMVAGT